MLIKNYNDSRYLVEYKRKNTTQISIVSKKKYLYESINMDMQDKDHKF